ncbi:MAG: hypothetical protein ACRDDH_11885 [Cetobacterium sp.]|uniref:hypothetical protein n=1 Tax=Cetobacterium sp. TaxID=2071632 RepID=UPI003EE4E7A4
MDRIENCIKYLNKFNTFMIFDYTKHKDIVEDLKWMVAEGYFVMSNPNFISTRKLIEYKKNKK